MKGKFVLLLAAAALLVEGCGGGEYGEFRKALRHQYRMMEEFTVAAAGASGPEEVAGALEKFRSEAVAGREWMAKLTLEHPGLTVLEKGNLPEDLLAELERIEEVTPRFIGALRRVEMEYGSDPGVRQALDGMGAVLSPPPR